MSPRDALRSYRRAWRRALPVWGNRRHPLSVEVCRRGDRLKEAFGRLGTDELPMEVIDALTTRDLRELKRMDRDGDDVCF
jgi:hypothetical protein